MPDQKSNDPLHGVTLKEIVTFLVDQFGWNELGERIYIHCFNYDPTIKSSLTFLRKTPWARKKVEDLYTQTQEKIKEAGNSIIEEPPKKE